MIGTNNYSTTYVVKYEVITTYVMGFGLEQDDGSSITPMALVHHRQPIGNKSRKKRRDLWVGRCVSS